MLQDYEIIFGCTKALACALKHRDTHTQLHSQRVVFLAQEIGKAYGLSDANIEILRVAAYFHDIGKIGIPDYILLKPEELNAEEWKIMKKHSEIGADIIKNLNREDSKIIEEAILHHHEHFDGSGYPHQLSQNEIPLFSKILGIADSYDAMTETRPYHKKKTHEETLAVLKKEKGKKSDPEILDLFLNIIDEIKHNLNE